MPTATIQAKLPPAPYFVIYRSPGTPADKVTDKFDNVKILLGQDVLQDIDMSRKEYIDTLTPDQKSSWRT